jgi:hypothetical protein
MNEEATDPPAAPHASEQPQETATASNGQILSRSAEAQAPQPSLVEPSSEAPGLLALPHEDEDEDPLVVAQREQEERERALAEAADISPSDDAAMRVSLFLPLDCISAF